MVDDEYDVPLMPAYVYVTDVTVAESEPPKFDKATVGAIVCLKLLLSGLALTFTPGRAAKVNVRVELVLAL